MSVFGAGSMAGNGSPLPDNITPLTGDFIVVHFLQRQAVGTTFLRTRNDWPLHITLVTWFTAPDPNELLRQLAATAAQLKQFDAVLGGEEDFAMDARVTVIERQKDMDQLHRVLLAAAQETGGVVRDGRWTGDAYRAHVTHHDNEPAPGSGERLTVDGFSLVRLLPGNRCGVSYNFLLGAK